MRRALSVLILCLVLAPVLPVSASVDAEANSGTPFWWEAPTSFSGGLVLRVSFTVPEPVFCTLRFGAIHHIDGSRPTVLLAYDPDAARLQARAVAYPGLVQVHTDGVDTRSTLAPFSNSSLGARFQLGVWVDQQRNLTFAASDLTAEHPDGSQVSPLFIELDCGDVTPSAAFVAGSRHVSVFTHNTMSGTGIVATGATLVDVHHEARFDTPEVLHVIGVDGELAVHAEACLRSTDPTGVRSYDLTLHPSLLIHGVGPAGTYRTDLEVLSAGEFLVWGLHAGLHPIDGVDELVPS